MSRRRPFMPVVLAVALASLAGCAGEREPLTVAEMARPRPVFIVGFDGDRSDVFERQYEFIQRAGIVTAMVGLLTAIPGTRLHTRLAREGRLLSSSTGTNVEATCNFI